MKSNVIVIINVIAVFLSPIIALLISKYLQDRGEKRRDKMDIFKTLMTGRLHSWDKDSIDALNMIIVIFSDDKNVINAWKAFRSTTKNGSSAQISTAKVKLMEIIGESLGYKNKVTWEDIQDPYKPMGFAEKLKEEEEIRKWQVEQMRREKQKSSENSPKNDKPKGQ